MIEQLINKGKVVRPYLGIQMIPAKKSGILITKVLPHSPASAAGLMDGDIITHVNLQKVNSPEEVLLSFGFNTGESKLRIQRNVPLEMDWDGRIIRKELLEKDILVEVKEMVEDDHFDLNEGDQFGT